jgi:hypothetical protein
MKTKIITSIVAGLFACIMPLKAQKVLEDWNGYVAYKNKGGTGLFNLVTGKEEKAAQTYHYGGPGRVNSVRVDGVNPGFIFSVPLRVSIFSVDSKGRPVSEIRGADVWFNTWNSFVQVDYSGGVAVNQNFAVVVAIRTGLSYPGQTFQLKYTGDGEGNARDLASVAGTSTGGNWSSALSSFGRDGDFYLIPKMSHDISAGFAISNNCLATNARVTFTNKSALTADSMFNKVSLFGYSGSKKLYLWQFGDGNTSTAANPLHTYTSAGSYTVKLITTVEGWNGSKSDTASLKISVGLSVSATGVTNLTCNGNNTGAVTASGSGGTSPYSYSLNGLVYLPAPTFTGLGAGPYTLYMRDALGCVASTTFTLTQPKAIVFGSIATSMASCNNADGAILANASGGTGTLQFRIDGGSWQPTGSFSGLLWGPHILEAGDANNCTVSTIVVIDNFSSPTLSVSYNNVSCNGGNDGSITLTSSGGTGAVQYSINGGLSYQSSGSFTGLPAGRYSALVKDVAGCGQGEVVIISQPSKIDYVVTTKPGSCFGKADGEIHFASAIGGIGKLSYSINGVNYQSSPDFYGIVGGNYTVYVKDVASCIVTKSVTVAQPNDIVTSKTLTDAKCYGSNNGSILAQSTGGTSPYYYSLNGAAWQATGLFSAVGAGTHLIVVRDANSCLDSITATILQPTLIVPSVSTTNSTCGNSNGGILATATGGSGSSYTFSLDGTNWINPGQFSGKKSGTYVVAVKDTAGCIVTINADIMDANGPVFGSISSTNITCNSGSDGSITVNSVSGGTGTIEYSLDGANWQTSNRFAGLRAGSYSIIIRDANKCISVSNTVSISQPSPIVLSKTITNVTCFEGGDGIASITATGGAGTMAYSINGGLSWQSDKNFYNLTAGSYSVIVRDAGGCTNSISFTITQPVQIATQVGILNLTCNGAQNGEITITASGGKAPYQYSLGGTYQSSNTFTGLAGGVYAYYVKDANACVTSGLVNLTEPGEIGLNGVASMISCTGGDNGVIDLTVSGGIAPYLYSWSTGARTEDIFNLKVGNYSVTVTDAYGCIASATWVLTQPTSPIIVNGVVTNSNGTGGNIDVTVTGGVPPYSFLWTNGKTTEDISSLSPGTYVVTVTDANRCEASNSFTVGVSTSISRQMLDENLKIYPNPANALLNVETGGYRIQTLRLLDNAGRLVLTIRPEGHSVQVNTSILVPGMYIVQVESEGAYSERKIIINR